jgi:hypothetical protein
MTDDDIERAEGSREKDLALLALILRELRCRGYRVTVETGRDVEGRTASTP